MKSIHSSSMSLSVYAFILLNMTLAYLTYNWKNAQLSKITLNKCSAFWSPGSNSPQFVALSYIITVLLIQNYSLVCKLHISLNITPSGKLTYPWEFNSQRFELHNTQPQSCVPYTQNSSLSSVQANENWKQRFCGEFTFSSLHISSGLWIQSWAYLYFILIYIVSGIFLNKKTSTS